jgi:hypothetical protein
MVNDFFDNVFSEEKKETEESSQTNTKFNLDEFITS